MSSNQEKIDACASEWQDQIKTCMGYEGNKTHEIKLVFDNDAFVSNSADMDDITEKMTSWNSWYIYKRISDAFGLISQYDEDEVTNAIWDGIDKIIIRPHKSGEDADKVYYDVDKHLTGKESDLILRPAFSCSGYDMLVPEDELQCYLKEAGFANQKDKKLMAFKSTCLSSQARWNLDPVDAATESYSEYDPSEAEQAEWKKIPGSWNQYYGDVTLIHPNGMRMEAYLVMSRSQYAFYDRKTAATCVGPLSLSSISYIDALPAKSKIPGRNGPITLHIGANEDQPTQPEPPKPCCSMKAPGIKLPGVKLPGVPLPKVDLPKVDLPSLPKIDLPKLSMPKIPLPDVPSPDLHLPKFEGFKRNKQKRPARYHPPMDTTCQLWIQAKNDSLALELAYVVYAYKHYASNNSEYPPYETDYMYDDGPKQFHEPPPAPLGSKCTIA